MDFFAAASILMWFFPPALTKHICTYWPEVLEEQLSQACPLKKNVKCATRTFFWSEGTFATCLCSVLSYFLLLKLFSLFFFFFFFEKHFIYNVVLCRFSLKKCKLCLRFDLHFCVCLKICLFLEVEFGYLFVTSDLGCAEKVHRCHCLVAEAEISNA